MAKETAESKLLKLIEESDAKDKSAPGAASPAAVSGAASDAARVFNSVSSVGISGVTVPSFLQKIFSMFSRRGRPSTPFGLRQVNQLLFLAIVAVTAFLFFDFSRGMKESQKKVAFEVKQMPFDPKSDMPLTPKGVAVYESAVNTRNIFHPFEKKAEEKKIVEPVENQKIKDKVVNFKLVGISWLNSAQTATVMIEDKATSITHFLKTGEDLQGVKIDTIYADRVEMSFQGEKMTMSL